MRYSRANQGFSNEKPKKLVRSVQECLMQCDQMLKEKVALNLLKVAIAVFT